MTKIISITDDILVRQLQRGYGPLAAALLTQVQTDRASRARRVEEFTRIADQDRHGVSSSTRRPVRTGPKTPVTAETRVAFRRHARNDFELRLPDGVQRKSGGS